MTNEQDKSEVFCALQDSYTGNEKLSLLSDHEGGLLLYAFGWDDYQNWESMIVHLSREDAHKLLEALNEAYSKLQKERETLYTAIADSGEVSGKVEDK